MIDASETVNPNDPIFDDPLLDPEDFPEHGGGEAEEDEIEEGTTGGT